MALMGIDWIFALALLLGGGALGVLIGRLFAADSGREKRLAEELEQTKKEFTSYKSDVESHFRETADAINEMTESYRVVHEKLRAGATRLCADNGPLLALNPSPRLEQQAAQSPAAEQAPEPAETTPEMRTEDTSTPATGTDQEAAPAEPTQEPPVEESAETDAAEVAAKGDEPDPEPAKQEAGEAEGEEAAAEDTTVTQPLDYAVDAEEKERDKTIH